MTTTSQRADLIAKHCQSSSSRKFLGSFNSQDLIAWVKTELGDELVLDNFVRYGESENFTKAIPHDPILHILSRNTPHAGLQSLVRGLLVGARNIVKLPSNSIPELEQWIQTLPQELAGLVEICDELSDEALDTAKTVIAIGSDVAIEAIQQKISPQQRYIPHGHKLSIGLIKSPTKDAADKVVKDACAFNQQGCLSLHTIYVMENARAFLPLLANAMAEYEQANPRGEISLSESGAISNLRETVRYEASCDPDNVALEHSKGNTNWTALYKNSPTLLPSTLNRVISVQPWPEDFSQLGEERHYLSTLSTEPELLEQLQELEIPRICLLGRAQKPSLSWHHDGFEPLASLMRWRDIEY